MTKADLENRVSELERQLEHLLEVLADVESALSSEDMLGAAADLGRLRPSPEGFDD